MELTAIGAIELLIAVALFVFGSVRALFVMVMAATLLGGSAAANLTTLGGSSISPAHLALGILLLRCLAPGGIGSASLYAAMKGNIWLI
ncbi:MAG: hypothetical protein QM681_14300, partial [Novosphingobium sp.]